MFLLPLVCEGYRILYVANTLGYMVHGCRADKQFCSSQSYAVRLQVGERGLQIGG